MRSFQVKAKKRSRLRTRHRSDESKDISDSWNAKELESILSRNPCAALPLTENYLPNKLKVKMMRREIADADGACCC